jgi:carnitine-CoA ligase
MTSWPDAVTFVATWERAVARGPANPFLVFEGPDGSSASWTYGEFDAVVSRCAAMLSARGVAESSAVSVALTNCPAFVAIWLATVRLGAWLVPSDPMAAEPELTGHILRTNPVIGFCAVDRGSTYRAAARDALVQIVEIDEADVALRVFGDETFRLWSTLSLTQRAAVMFTSGTTGVPKGVEITQANYAFAGATMASASGLRREDRQLVVLPLFHANAQFYSFAAAIWAGASVALMHTFSASGFLAQAARHRATHASLFAAPIRMILSRGATPVAEVSLKHCWYAMNITPAQHVTMTGLLGCAPRQLYGMTETIPAVLSEPASAPDPEAMGYPTQNCVVDLQPNDQGDLEIVVGGQPGVTLFAGYLDDPATTSASFRDGWFLTGDRAHRRGDGRFIFDGRRSDVLKVAGENVSTVEVEQVIAAFPGVLEVAVVGHPDEIRDEVPVAFVVATDPVSPPDLDALRLWCEHRLTKSKRPRDITLVEQLPRTSVGKIRKFLLRDGAAESLQHPPTKAPTLESGSIPV